MPFDLHARLLADLVNEGLLSVDFFEVFQNLVKLALLQILVAIRPVSDLLDLVIVKLEVLLNSLLLGVDDGIQIQIEADFALFLLICKLLLMVKELRNLLSLLTVNVLDELQERVNRVCVSHLHKDLPKLPVNAFAVLFVVPLAHFDVDDLLFFKRDCILLSVELFVPRESAEDQLVDQKNQRLNVVLKACLLAVELPQGREHQVAHHTVVGSRDFLKLEFRNHAKVDEGKFVLRLIWLAALDLLPRRVGVSFAHAHIVTFDISVYVALFVEQRERQQQLAEHVEGDATPVVATHPSKVRDLGELIQTDTAVSHHDLGRDVADSEAENLRHTSQFVPNFSHLLDDFHKVHLEIGAVRVFKQLLLGHVLF